MKMPLGLGGLQLTEHDGGRFLGGTAHSELHGHDGNAQHNEAGDIDQDKDGTAVLAHHPGEFPYVADADGASGGEKNKA